MEWEKEALEIVEEIPLPPMIAHFAKMDAERRAKKGGLTCVTVAIAKETEAGYEKALGKEAVKLLRAMARGEDVQLPDEFFVEEPEELYSLQLCPAKFGASTLEKREQMRQLLSPIRNKLKELGITQILMDKAQTSLMSHHIFRIGITGCPNACFSPYFMDFGVLGKYRPGVKNEECTRCGQCVKYCSEHAILLEAQGPVIDYQKCIMCAGCVEVCEQGAFFTEKKGYKVVAGGTGSRHPNIAQTIVDFTNLKGVLMILENIVNLIKETPVEGRVITVHDVLKKQAVKKIMV